MPTPLFQTPISPSNDESEWFRIVIPRNPFPSHKNQVNYTTKHVYTHPDERRERMIVEVLIKKAWEGRAPLKGAVAVAYVFMVKAPQSSKKMLDATESDLLDSLITLDPSVDSIVMSLITGMWHQNLPRCLLPTTRPDEGNYTYFYDNRLENSVILDDAQIAYKFALKKYSSQPAVAIFVRALK